ncbi:hypothetical protein C1646_764466 [Rhizophagus diaphanus]|nr:hypothetical protein C1646_764466 [Rhizophagus diaphanus] [Rhizophagus sp. MUCL 43196]
MISTSEAELLIPYGKYFEFFPTKVWSLQHFSKMISEYYEINDKRVIHNIFYKTLKSVANDQNLTEDSRNIAKELIEKRMCDTKKRDIETLEAEGSSTSKKKKITQSKFITLKVALSRILPHIAYSPYVTSSKSTTKVGGNPPKKVLLWQDFFNSLNVHHFDDAQMKFKEPQFMSNFKVTNEEVVRQIINVNIFIVLNELMPDYEYSMRKVPGDGTPDYTCYYLGNTLILVIEIKRVHILSEIGPGLLSDFYKINPRVKNVVQQIYYYMSENQLQYGILSTYDEHWFVKRDHQDLYITEPLLLGSTSPTVLEAYAFLAQLAKERPFSKHPNII